MCQPAAWNLMHLAQHWARSLSFTENPTPQRQYFSLGFHGYSDQPLKTIHYHSATPWILHPCFYRAPVQSSAVVALRRWIAGIPLQGNDGKATQEFALTTLWPILAKESTNIHSSSIHGRSPIHYHSQCPSKHPIYANPRIILPQNAAGSLRICTFHWATLLLEADWQQKPFQLENLEPIAYSAYRRGHRGTKPNKYMV